MGVKSKFAGTHKFELGRTVKNYKYGTCGSFAKSGGRIVDAMFCWVRKIESTGIGAHTNRHAVLWEAIRHKPFNCKSEKVFTLLLGSGPGGVDDL